MGLFLEVHTLLRMKQRGITRDEVEEALTQPYIAHPSAEHPGSRTVILGETAAGRRLKVVVLTHEPNVIITVCGRDE